MMQLEMMNHLKFMHSAVQSAQAQMDLDVDSFVLHLRSDKNNVELLPLFGEFPEGIRTYTRSITANSLGLGRLDPGSRQEPHGYPAR